MKPRVLIVRFSAIGDCVMSAWAATAVRNRYPEAHLVWAAESRCSPVIDRARLTSDIAEFPRDRWKRKRWSANTWREQILAFTRLRAMRFDVGFDLQGHSKTALCLRLANPSQRFAGAATDPVAGKLNPVVPGRPEGTHNVEWNHRVLCAFEQFELPERPIMPAVEARSEPGKVVTISVGAGHPKKVYPADSWRFVAKSLQADGFRVEFLGGPTDTPISMEGAVDLVGKLSLNDTMTRVAQSDLHLAADTGTGHMAAAYGVPVVSVFSFMDPREYRPYSSQAVVLHEGIDPTVVSPERVLEAARSLACPRGS